MMWNIHKNIVQTLCVGIFLFSIVTPVHAQLSSSNYQIDSFIIGQEGSDFAESTNYTVEYKDTTITALEHTYGFRKVTNGTTTSISVDNIPTQQKVPPVIPPVLTPTAHTDNPAGVGYINIGKNDIVTFIPTYSESEYREAQADKAVTTYYTVLSSGAVAELRIPAGAFLRPDDALRTYEVYILITELPLVQRQMPDPSLHVSQIGENAFLLTAVDSNDVEITVFNKPIQVTVVVDSSLDYANDVYGYSFSSALPGWIREPDILFDTQSFSWYASHPQLLALWTGRNMPNILSIHHNDNFDVSHSEITRTSGTSMYPTLTSYIWIVPWILIGLLGASVVLMLWMFMRKYL